MGLSNYVPSSRISQAGVCTSSTRPASPYEGQVIYETDTNRVLVWDASAWVMIADTNQPPGLQLVKTQTVGTAVASVTVSDAFSADFDAYEIILSGGTGSLTTGLNLSLGSANANYYMGRSFVDWQTATYGDTSVNNGGVFSTAGAMTLFGLSFNVRIVNPFLAARTTIHGQFTTISPSGEAQLLAGFLNDTTSYTSFAITCAAGTMTGGTIRVYGYRN